MKLYGSVVCLVFNGGWTYPGLDYMINRVTNEITRDDLHPESKFPAINYVYELIID